MSECERFRSMSSEEKDAYQMLLFTYKRYKEISNIGSGFSKSDQIVEEQVDEPIPSECIICKKKYDSSQILITTPCCCYSCHLGCLVQNLKETKEQYRCPMCGSKFPANAIGHFYSLWNMHIKYC